MACVCLAGRSCASVSVPVPIHHRASPFLLPFAPSLWATTLWYFKLERENCPVTLSLHTDNGSPTMTTRASQAPRWDTRQRRRRRNLIPRAPRDQTSCGLRNLRSYLPYLGVGRGTQAARHKRARGESTHRYEARPDPDRRGPRRGLPSDKTRAFPRSRLLKASSQSEHRLTPPTTRHHPTAPGQAAPPQNRR